MANDPNKQQPNDDAPDSGEDESALPPWLRGDAPPPVQPSAPSSIPRLAPRQPPPGDADPSVPPWLRGMEPPQEKKVVIGGREVSMDFFDEADSLAQDSNTDLTYDAWLAEQIESRREKSVEEELPDFFTEINASPPTPNAAPDQPSAYPIRDVTGGTSQLPDWFLGLDEIDDSDAPDWVRQIGSDSSPQLEPEPDPTPAITDFFQDMGLPVEEDSFSDLNLPDGAFFSELVGKPATDDLPVFGAAATPAAPGTTRRLDDDDPFADFDLGSTPAPPAAPGTTRRLDDDDPFADFDLGSTPAPAAAPGTTRPLDDDDPFADFDNHTDTPTIPSPTQAVDIPQIELDAFLSGLEGLETIHSPQPSPAPSFADIEDPDLDLFMPPSPPPAPEPAPAQAEPTITEDDLNWLNELEGIVSSVTRGDAPPSRSDAGLPASFDDIPAFEIEPLPEPGTTPIEFDWDESPVTPPTDKLYAPPEPEPASTQELDWLNSIDADESAHQAPTTQVPPEELERLGLLRALDPQPPRPAQPTPEEPAAVQDDLASLYADPFADESDAFAAAGLEAIDFGDAPSTQAADTSGIHIDAGTLERLNALSGYAPDESAVFDAELRSGWMDDALLDEAALIDSALMDSSLDIGTSAPARQTAPDPLDMLREPEPPTPIRTTFDPEIAEDEPSDTIDFGLFDAPAQPAESGYTPLFGGYTDDDDQPETLDLSLFDEPDAAPTQPAAQSTGFTGLLSAFDEDDDQPETLDLSLFDEPDAAPAQPAAQSGYTPLFGGYTEDDDQPETLDLSLFDEPDAAPAQPAAQSGYTPLFGGYTDDDDQPETLDLSLFDEPDAAPAQPAAQSGYTPLFGGYTDDDDQPETLDLSLFDEPDAAPAQPAASGYTPLFGGYTEDDDQPETLDLSLFDEPDAAPAQPAASGYTPLFGGYTEDDDQPETLDLSLFDEPDTAPAQPAAFSDPHATMPVRDELAAEDDWQPYIPTAEPGNVESAASDDFVDSFSLDDLAPSRPRLSDDLFEVDDILAELDSQSDLAEEDTQQQPALILDDEELQPDFGFIDDKTGTDDPDLEALFGGMSSTSADPLAAAWDDAPSAQPAQTESPFAMPTLDDSYDAPIPGFGEGLQWAMDDEPGTAGSDARQIEDFLANRSPFTLDADDAPPSKAPPAPAPKPAAPPVFEDLDTYLESIDIDLSGPGQGQMTGALFNDPGKLDIDAMLDREVVPGEPTRRGGIPPFTAPDAFGLEAADISFLQGAGASVEDVSAGALVRQQQDRPVDDLPPSLRRLRERSRQAEEAAAAAEASMERDSLSEMLPGVDIGLAPVRFTGAANVERAIALTPDQTMRAALLASIAGTAPERPRISAIELTYDSPFMEDLADDEENIVHPSAAAAAPAAATPRRRARRRVRIQPDRLLVGLLLALAVIAPFVLRDVRVGDPPPASFEMGSPGARAFAALNGLGRGDLVLIGLEYAPASAGELDGMTDALLRHIVLRGAIPVVVSGSPLALLRAESRFEALNADAALLARIESRQPLERGIEYHIGRLLAGGLIGVRALSAAPELLTADINSTTDGLGIRGLDDFALVVLIADNGEAARDYAEQIAPFARAPFVAAVSYSAAPLAGAYVGADVFDALLAGYTDALTYSARLADVTPVSRRIRIIRTPAPVELPTVSTPDAPPEAAIAPEATDESGAPIIAESTPEATALPPTPAPLTAVVSATQRVNMRAAPSSTAQVITGVEPGTRLTLLGSSADGAWANVELADGRRGWISAPLLRIVTGAPKARPVRAPREQDVDFPPTNTRPPTRVTPATAMPTRTPAPPSPTPTRTPAPPSPTVTLAEAAGVEPAAVETETPLPSDTPTASRTPAPTLTPTAEATSTPAPPPPTREPLVFSEGLQGERWYGINLGIIMSVLIISGGAIFNIIRALLRRR